ncbi:MAG: hypothetical protein Q9219_006577 [cf. Caloplaca sp. 3 TL-2023]
MLTHRLSASFHVFKSRSVGFGLSQQRGARVVDSRFLVTHRQTDRFTEKYRDKLQRKAQQEGLESVDELKAAYKARAQEGQGSKSAAITISPQGRTAANPPPSTALKPASSCSPSLGAKSTAPLGFKTLSSFLDLEKITELPPKEIEYVWRLRHASSPLSLCGTIPSSTYAHIRQRARKHPQFILPLPREGSAGAEIHFLQWSFPAPDAATVVFTHLAEYKLRGEFSQPHTTITMHSELMQEKGLVLMQGQVVEGRGIHTEEARWLMLCLQKFYGWDNEIDGGRKRLLELFSQGDWAFRIEDLVEEAEKIA